MTASSHISDDAMSLGRRFRPQSRPPTSAARRCTPAGLLETCAADVPDCVSCLKTRFLVSTSFCSSSSTTTTNTAGRCTPAALLEPCFDGSPNWGITSSSQPPSAALGYRYSSAKYNKVQKTITGLGAENNNLQWHKYQPTHCNSFGRLRASKRCT